MVALAITVRNIMETKSDSNIKWELHKAKLKFVKYIYIYIYIYGNYVYVKKTVIAIFRLKMGHDCLARHY